MYFKMAYKNVRKSLKDYLIYFLTLTFAICIFYSFNAMGQQQAMAEITNSQKATMQTMSILISLVSVFVSFILGGLIIYANNFLIKKRKKELGIYMTLGMGKNKMSKVLFFENFFIGLLALGTGLVIGIVLSQGLSILTAHLFEIALTKYQFVFSMGALLKTIIYFGIIFSVVMIFNTLSIRRYELIDLLRAGQKNEELKTKNPVINIVLFLVSVILIGAAYILAIKVGLDVENPSFYGVIALGIGGTFLFLYSLIGFILMMLMKQKHFYLKGLNLFVVRQIYYKVNTHFASMSVICLMLFLTISMLSTGLGFKNVIEKGLIGGTPFDATAGIYFFDGLEEAPRENIIRNEMDEAGLIPYQNSQAVYYNQYISMPSIRDLLLPYAEESERSNIENLWEGSSVTAIKLSDYNALRALQGKEPAQLDKNKVLVLSNMEGYQKTVKNLINSGDELLIAEESYPIQNQEVLQEQFTNEGFCINYLSLIIPDETANHLPIYSMQMSVNYNEGYHAEEEKRFEGLLEYFRSNEYISSHDDMIFGYTRESLYAMQMGITNSILFVCIYMGLIFLLSSAAVLALQQLAEAGESKARYKALTKIGAPQHLIRRAILVQVFIYFMLPLGLACIHAIVGIRVVNDFLVNFGKPNIIGSALVTAVLLLMIYGGYFLATYSGYKTIVQEERR